MDKRHENPSSSDKVGNSPKNTPEKPLDLIKNASKKDTRKEEKESPDRNHLLNDDSSQNSTSPHNTRVPRHESKSDDNEIAPRPSCDDELAQAIKMIREEASYDWFPIDKDTQLCIEQLDKTLQDWNKHVEKTLQEYNQPEVLGKYRLDYKIQKDELKISNGDRKSLSSLPLKIDKIKDFYRHLQNQKERSIEEIIKDIECAGIASSIKNLDRTLQDWNRHVEKTLQEPDQSEKPDNYRLSNKIQENKLNICKGNNKDLFSLLLEKDDIECLDSYLQIMKERFSINETIKKLEKIGLSDSIEQLKDTLQDWNNHGIPDKYRLSIKYLDNQAIEIINDKGEHMLSLPLEKEKIEQFNSMLQEWDHHANQHEKLITQSKINENDPDIQDHRTNLKVGRDRFFYSLQEPSTTKEWIDELAMNNKQFKDSLDKRNTTYKEDTVKTKSHLRAISSANRLEKSLYDWRNGKEKELDKRAAFDTLYKTANDRLQEVTNELNRLLDLDRTSNADTDVHSDAKKLRSEKIITRLNDTIEKFELEMKELENLYNGRQQMVSNILSCEEKKILQSIENSEAHRKEMQRRRQFDRIYNAIALRCPHPDKAQLLLKELLQDECKRINKFTKDEKEHFQAKLFGHMNYLTKLVEKWYQNNWQERASVLQKEIEQIKKLEDYRRSRKDSKFGTH